jgi:hypothetical protein
MRRMSVTGRTDLVASRDGNLLPCVMSVQVECDCMPHASVVRPANTRRWYHVASRVEVTPRDAQHTGAGY